MNHIFDVSEATQYGVNKAILLYNLRFWLDKNKANKKNIKEVDGKTYVWTYNSASAFAELFPYMKESSIRRWLKELEDDGVIKSHAFNRHAYDKTKWYTIVAEYELDLAYLTIAQNERSNDHNERRIDQNERSNDHNEQPIPDVNTDRKTDVTTDGPTGTGKSGKYKKNGERKYFGPPLKSLEIDQQAYYQSATPIKDLLKKRR